MIVSFILGFFVGLKLILGVIFGFLLDVIYVDTEITENRELLHHDVVDGQIGTSRLIGLQIVKQ